MKKHFSPHDPRVVLMDAANAGCNDGTDATPAWTGCAAACSLATTSLQALIWFVTSLCLYLSLYNFSVAQERCFLHEPLDVARHIGNRDLRAA